MATIIEDTFNSGSFNGTWVLSSPQAPSVQSESAFEGGYGARCQTSTASTDVFFKYNAVQQTRVWTRWYWRFRDNAIVDGNYAWFIVVNIVGYNDIYINLADTTHYVNLATNMTLRSTTTRPVATGIWYHVQLYCYANGASSEYTLKINGETLTDTTNFATANVTEVIFNCWTPSAVLTTTDYDYVTISDSAYPDFVHQDVRPSVDVNDGNWTTHDPPSSSNLAAQIDETTIDKTDYIQSQAF